MSRAQPAQAARSECAGHAHSAQVVDACRDLPALPSQPPRSRRHFDVATSWRPSHVATSHWCRDTVSPAQHQARSRPLGRPTYVATSTPCRDILKTNLCRDIVFMSQPPRLMSMSRHQAQPSHCRPCRDLTMMSRHQACSAPFLLRRDAILPCRDVLCSHLCRDLTMMSRHQAALKASNPVANPTRSRRPFLVATSRPTNPGRDLISMSRPPQVLTCNEIFFFFFHPTAPFFFFFFFCYSIDAVA